MEREVFLRKHHKHGHNNNKPHTKSERSRLLADSLHNDNNNNHNNNNNNNTNLHTDNLHTALDIPNNHENVLKIDNNNNNKKSSISSLNSPESFQPPPSPSISVSDSVGFSDVLVEDPPEDKWLLAYWILMALGFASLLPWNALITAGDFFDDFYPKLHAEYTFPFIYNLPGFVVSLLMAAYGELLPKHPRMVISLLIFVSAMQGIALMIALHAENHENLSGNIIRFLVALFGASTSVTTASLFAFSAQFPPIYTQSVVTGQAVSGILVVILQFILKAAFGSHKRGERKSSFVYFQFSMVVVAFCVVMYAVLLKLPVTQYYTQAREEASNRFQKYGTVTSLSASPSLGPQQPQSQLQILTDTLREVWPLGFGVMYVFVVTLAIFPGVSISIDSEMGIGKWYSLILLALFMIGDLLGRVLSKWWIWLSEKSVLVVILLRSVFVLFFLAPHIFHWKIPDPVVMIAMLIMATSNGYLASLTMMFGPSKVQQRLKRTAGVVMGSFLSLGILLGSTLAYMFHLWVV